MALTAAAALVAAPGCVTDGGPFTTPIGDTGVFYAEVEPVLTARCANPACHGSDDRPFELYAVGWHRADPEQDWRAEPLTPEERGQNLDRASGFRLWPGLLWRKPLAVSAGGADHEGGVVFADAHEADVRTLRQWSEAP